MTPRTSRPPCSRPAEREPIGDTDAVAVRDRMMLVGRAHDAFVAARRVRRLATLLGDLLPEGATVLDLGCGDGQVAGAIQARRPDLTIRGVDVLLRPHTHIPVDVFDGTTIPHGDRSLDAVLIADVLHHTDDPNVLLREAARVARVAVVIKDHLRDGPLAAATLRLMDYVGNARHGVRLPYNYWTRAQWSRAFADSGLSVERWSTTLALYPPPASWVFDRSLHFVARLTPRSAER